jgi:hypothetical protein
MIAMREAQEKVVFINAWGEGKICDGREMGFYMFISCATKLS